MPPTEYLHVNSGMRSETGAVEGFRMFRGSLPPCFLAAFNSFCQCLNCVKSVGTEAEVGVKLAWWWRERVNGGERNLGGQYQGKKGQDGT